MSLMKSYKFGLKKIELNKAISKITMRGDSIEKSCLLILGLKDMNTKLKAKMKLYLTSSVVLEFNNHSDSNNKIDKRLSLFTRILLMVSKLTGPI